MKMINDMDMYYANVYTKTTRPMWMKDERIDYCDTTEDHKTASLFHLLFHKNVK